MTESSTRLLEEKMAHLLRQNDELSDIVRDQADRISVMERRIAMLMRSAAATEAEAGATIPLGDQRPPHW